jgi:hypothetical protein
LTGTASININGTVGATTANTGAFTTLTTSSTVTLNGGTANGVAYLDGSKVLTTGSALTFDGSQLGIGTASGTSNGLKLNSGNAGANYVLYRASATGLLTIYGNQTGFNGLTVTGIDGDLATLTSSGLEVKQSQLIGYSSYAGLGSYGLAVAGNVGIGTSSPFTRLESAAARATTLNSIASFNTMAASVTDTTAFAVGVGGGINFRAQLTASTYSTYASIWSFRESANTSDYKGSLIFGTSDNGDGYPEERMRLDSAGNLGLGVPSSAWSIGKAIEINNAGSAVWATSVSDLNLLSNAYYNSNYMYAGSGLAAGRYQINSGVHYWYRSTSAQVAGTDPVFEQAMTLDASGNLLVGTTTTNLIGTDTSGTAITGTGRFDINRNGDCPMFLGRYTSTGDLLQFYYAGALKGSISTNGTTTSYNVTSDERLKENIQDAAPASALIDALQVRQYDWKADGTHQRYGFIAQELVTVAPEAVHQPTDPDDMMAVDYSKLVPMLVKEIQSLRKRLTALEAK